MLADRRLHLGHTRSGNVGGVRGEAVCCVTCRRLRHAAVRQACARTRIRLPAAARVRASDKAKLDKCPYSCIDVRHASARVQDRSC